MRESHLLALMASVLADPTAVNDRKEGWADTPVWDALDVLETVRELEHDEPRTVVAANDGFVFCSDGAVFTRTGYQPRWQEVDPIPGTARALENEELPPKPIPQPIAEAS